MFELEGLDHVAFAVADVKRSADWYVEVLGFEHRYQGMWNGVPLFVGKGNTAIAIFPKRSKTDSGTRSEASAGMLHLAMRANRENFIAAQQALTARGINFHFQDHEISHSIYFEDLDGIRLEITTYELS